MGVHNSARGPAEVVTRRDTLPQHHYDDPLNGYAINRLLELALRFVEHDFHQPSRTHISFCLYVGKFGIRGVGVTARAAYVSYKSCLDQTLTTADHPELAHWLTRFDSFVSDRTHESAKDAQTSPEEVAPRRTAPIQIGMRLPIRIYEQLSDRAVLGNNSWNEFVSEHLNKEAIRFDQAANKTSAENLTADMDSVFQASGIKNTDQDILKSWSQRVPKTLHTKLVSLAHEFGYSLSRFATYLLLKSQNYDVSNTKKTYFE